MMFNQASDLGRQILASRQWARWRERVRPLLESRLAIVGLCLVMFWILVALFAPLISPYDPLVTNPQAMNVGPSLSHMLGTDDMGRDLWARLAYGSQLILILSIVSVLSASAVGIFFGLTAGYFSGWIDELVMRILDAIMAFPAILLYLIIIASIGPSTLNVVIAVTIAGAPGVARLVRSLTIDIRTREYIAAARLRGENPIYVMFVEILPNASGPILVDAMLRVGYTIFHIGTLGFLGLGPPPPTPDWGSIVFRGRLYIWNNPWTVLWPSLAISSLVVGINLLVDGIRTESKRKR